VEKATEFLDRFKSLERKQGLAHLLYIDRKAGAFYVLAHLDGKTLVERCDLEATLDADEDDVIYKLNREVTEDQPAYKQMKADAQGGRSFEDLVIEYDLTYNEEKPLKVYGGQHRVRAISEAVGKAGDVYHGARVYFDLTRDQKVEIATINNTSIAVPNDLLDRMREQLLGSELRDWCQKVGLLQREEDFSDRKSPEVPTVRIARTLIVNYYKGKESTEIDFHQPVICKSGGLDEMYAAIRQRIDWEDPELCEMGKQFNRLHRLQRERVLGRDTDNYAEFARKALSLTVVAAWAYATGLFQHKPEQLKNHFALPDSVTAPEDPLNAKALSQARMKGIDPETYRGLGARTGPRELGRMFEVFHLQATQARDKRITKTLPNVAIQSYEAKFATYEAGKALRKI